MAVGAREDEDPRVTGVGLGQGRLETGQGIVVERVATLRAVDGDDEDLVSASGSDHRRTVAPAPDRRVHHRNDPRTYRRVHGARTRSRRALRAHRPRPRAERAGRTPIGAAGRGHLRVPGGAEAAIWSILEAVPDPRNHLALTRDLTGEVRITGTPLDPAYRAAAEEQIDLTDLAVYDRAS